MMQEAAAAWHDSPDSPVAVLLQLLLSVFGSLLQRKDTMQLHT